MSVFRRDRDSSRSLPVQPLAEPAAVAAPEQPKKPTSTAPPAPLSAPAAGVTQPSTAPLPRDAAAIVDKKSEITGTLHSQGNVLVEGAFDGEIEAKETVWVEKGAQTKGQLRANDVVISGSFDGQITCQRRLQIASTATIRGEINTPVLVIEEGSTVDCRFKMTRGGR